MLHGCQSDLGQATVAPLQGCPVKRLAFDFVSMTSRSWNMGACQAYTLLISTALVFVFFVFSFPFSLTWTVKFVAGNHLNLYKRAAIYIYKNPTHQHTTTL